MAPAALIPIAMMAVAAGTAAASATGALGGGAKSPAPTPVAPTKDTAAEKSEARRKAIVAAYGSQPFMTTGSGGAGLTTEATTAPKTLLGA